MRSHWITASAFAAAAHTALAAPQQLAFSAPSFSSLSRTSLDDALRSAWNGVQHSRPVGWAEEGVRKFTEVVDNAGSNFELIQHADFPLHSLRMKKPEGLCDSSSKSYSGYLDISDDAHLFYWFFESRSAHPEKDPLVLWLNGGPGCSSTTGLLFELGPCRIADGGKNTTYNPHSWTESANVIFLDSPVQVGYSYGGKTVSNSQDTAEDIYSFLQLFYEKFPKFRDVDFHISGESYAGTYLPNIASVIHRHNKNKPTPNSLDIPMKSVLIGNGLTNACTSRIPRSVFLRFPSLPSNFVSSPSQSATGASRPPSAASVQATQLLTDPIHTDVQFASIPDWSCKPGGNPYHPIFSEQECRSIESKVPTCQRLVDYCYKAPSRFTCVPATLSCWQIAGPIQQSGLNPYDIRKKCDRSKDGDLCYKEMGWIETYMNDPEVRRQLGAAKDVTFASCNMQVNQAFQLNGDVSKNTAALIPPLLEDGIRFLIYAGSADFMCNSKGNYDWTIAMEWKHAAKYRKAKLVPFKSGKETAGHTQAVSPDGGAGLLRYLELDDAGHMVPFDQPERSLDFFTRWIRNEAFE
ncbi:Alpha/Beta hydrolase fold [Rhodotorula toruloides]|uniref:Carboxypeptidase n=1 Tax=Rhodotorula toruloides TaxID=5286 RepID=A0A2T0A546_RHOTO|nr:Alpha/Beta hydrolase fold [Rhodotorula toruloides]